MKTILIAILMLVAIEVKGQMTFVGNAYNYYTKDVYAVYLDTLSISCYQDIIYHSPTFSIEGKIINKKGEAISQTFCYEFDHKVPYHSRP